MTGSAADRPAGRNRPRGLPGGIATGALWLAALLAGLSPASAQPPPADPIPRLIRSGEAAAALKHIDERLAQRPNDVRLWTLRGLALTQLKRAEESLAAYRKALTIDPASLTALQGAAQIEYGTRRPEAPRTLRRILELDPSNVVAHAMLGTLAYEREDCATALRHFRRGETAVERNPQAVWQTAHCLFVEGHAAEAAERFDRLLETGGLEGRPAELAAFNAALSLHTAGRHAAAVEKLEPLAARQPPEEDVLLLLADAYAADRRVDQAVATLRGATTVFPRDERFYVALAALCIEHDSFDLGREIVEIGLRNVPESARLLTLRGTIHALLGAFDEAEADFEHVARLQPQERAAIAGLSLTLEKTGQLDQSVAVLREQARIRPDDDVINVLLAQALLRGPAEEGAIEEARRALLRAVAAAPRRAMVRTELGKLYLKTGDTEKGIEQLQTALELDPSDRRATYQLLVALQRAGRQAEAQKLATRVRELLDDEKESELARNRFRLVKAEPQDERK